MCSARDIRKLSPDTRQQQLPVTVTVVQFSCVWNVEQALLFMKHRNYYGHFNILLQLMRSKKKSVVQKNDMNKHHRGVEWIGLPCSPPKEWSRADKDGGITIKYCDNHDYETWRWWWWDGVSFNQTIMISLHLQVSSRQTPSFAIRPHKDAETGRIVVNICPNSHKAR